MVNNPQLYSEQRKRKTILKLLQDKGLDEKLMSCLLSLIIVVTYACTKKVMVEKTLRLWKTQSTGYLR